MRACDQVRKVLTNRLVSSLSGKKVVLGNKTYNGPDDSWFRLGFIYNRQSISSEPVTKQLVYGFCVIQGFVRKDTGDSVCNTMVEDAADFIAGYSDSGVICFQPGPVRPIGVVGDIWYQVNIEVPFKAEVS